MIGTPRPTSSIGTSRERDGDVTLGHLSRVIDSDTILALVILVCLAGLFAPLVVALFSRRVWTFNDLAALHVPLRHVYSAALKRGDSMLWSPAFHSGYYLYAEGQAGMAHPMHLLLYRVLPLDLAFNIEIIASYVMAAVGMRVLLGRLDLTTPAAWFGAMIFAFDGFNLAHLIHVNAIAVLAHLPWLLVSAHVLFDSTRPRDRAVAFAGMALLIASAVLLGYPQYVWMILLAVAYAVACFALARLAVVPTVYVGAALVFGLLIGAVQWVPTLDLMKTSIRSAPTLDFRLSFSLPVVNLVQLWAPAVLRFAPVGIEDPSVHEFMGGESVYTGAFCSLALLWLVVRLGHVKHQRMVVALVVFAAGSLALALGRYGPFYVRLAGLPGLNAFRAPARHLALFHAALSGLAAIAFEDVIGVAQRRQRVSPRRLWLFGVFVAVAAATVLTTGSLTGSRWADTHRWLFASFGTAAPWLAVLGVTAWLLVLTARGLPWAPAVLIGLVALDQGVWGYSFDLSRRSLQSVRNLAAIARVPSDARPGESYEAMATGSGPARNLGVLRDLRLSSGYLGLVPMPVRPPDVAALQIAGVQWRVEGDGWVRVAGAMPRARLVATARSTEDADIDVHRIDVGSVALVDRALQALAGPPGDVRVVVDRPGHLVLRTSAPAPQLLVLTERFHEGWQVRQDGRPGTTVRVYSQFLGCVVGAGFHRVELTFAPASLADGLRLMWIGLALTAVWTALLWCLPAPADRWRFGRKAAA
jgi:hypothetical protein